MTRRKRFVFALIAVSVPFVLIASALAAIDVYLHQRFARTGGFNVWGYRGPIAPRKALSEYRVVMVGGSTVFGYGVTWDEAIPRLLERDLLARSPDRFSVVNLGYNNEGAYSFAFTLRDYQYLKYDLAILYEGYNDMMGDARNPNLSVFRHDSPVFRLTGYLPIFPIVFREKAAVMLTGSAASMYPDGHAERTVFRPRLGARASAGILNATADIGESLGRQLDKVTAEAPRVIEHADRTGCKQPWREYCRSVERAVQISLDINQQVLVVTQPHLPRPDLRARHVDQQRELAQMVARRFASDPRVGYVNLGSALALSDPALTFDGMHLNQAGNQMVADALVDPVLQMAAAHTSARAR